MKFRLKKKPLHPWWWLGGFVVAYVALVAGNITRWSIWFDEAFSAYLMRFDIAAITRYTAEDVHPPLYYWLLKGWTELFGMSELAVRSLSTVFGVVAIIGLYMLVERLFRSPRWALWVSGAVALSPLLIRFGHEARMYTLALAIVVWASYVLVRAMEKRSSNKWWIGYALLLAAGMLTHYYVALAWFAHWAWRFFERRAGRIKQFFSKEWIWTHVLAIGLFVWWLPTAIKQFSDVQKGFWIPDVSAYTPVDYASNLLLYRQYGDVTGWWALVFVLAVAAAVAVARLGYPYLQKRSPYGLSFLATMATVPPLLLLAVSMPPLISTFMDRYIFFAQVALVAIVMLAAAAVYERSRKNRTYVHGFLVMLGICTVLGIGNVYYFGNYNKNSNTSIRVREVVEQINAASSNSPQPIIAASPWMYYEAAFYETKERPVYFLDSTTTNYQWGSLAMLRDHDTGKIMDVHEFGRQHRYVWFMDNNQHDVTPPVESWKRITSVDAYDYIDDNTKYRASLFDTQPSAE